MNIPDAVECACCGLPLRWDNSYGVSIPWVEPGATPPIKAGDFCSIECLYQWAADHRVVEAAVKARSR